MIQRLLPWALLALVLLFFYWTRAILLPFVAGFAIAYFLDPVADKLEEWRIPRGIAAAAIIAVFFLVIFGFFVALWPILQDQIAGIVVALPETLTKLRPLLDQVLAKLGENLDIAMAQDAEGLLAQTAERALGAAGEAAGGLISGGLALLNLLGLLVISPVVAFYLLRDYDLIVAKIDSWLPREYEPTIREQLVKINAVLAGFVRGQVIVCMIMAALYAIGWSAVGLKFGLILGLVAGVMAFIPFVGMLFAAIIAVLIAFGQFGPDPIKLGLVAGVWLAVQLLEGSVLTPRLLGSRVGLHPVWVLFAVFAGGEVMGFVGVLIAVPAAAVIAVLVRWSIEHYLAPHARRPSADPPDDGPAGSAQAAPAPDPEGGKADDAAPA